MESVLIDEHALPALNRRHALESRLVDIFADERHASVAETEVCSIVVDAAEVVLVMRRIIRHMVGDAQDPGDA